jgi:hypothetical protein
MMFYVSNLKLVGVLSKRFRFWVDKHELHSPVLHGPLGLHGPSGHSIYGSYSISDSMKSYKICANFFSFILKLNI